MELPHEPLRVPGLGTTQADPFALTSGSSSGPFPAAADWLSAPKGATAKIPLELHRQRRGKPEKTDFETPTPPASGDFRLTAHRPRPLSASGPGKKREAP